MNGATTRKGNAFDEGRQPPFQAAAQPVAPNGKALVEGYRNDILGGFEQERPRFNPLNTERPQSSALVDLADPIQVHLLTETALSDSKAYEILSQEEVDDLKKKIQSLTMRVEQARTNLAIQSKYRDAAISMARLYSPARPESKRRSLIGGSRVSDSAKEAEMEKQTSERRCEELATELFTLEKRLMEPQKRLLQHTAGILQMTHRASTKKTAKLVLGQPLPNGIPGSPESLYTHTNSRNSLEPTAGDDIHFDERSLYLPLDQMEQNPVRQRKNTIEIPVKSPVREQNNQLREEMDRIRDENERLKSAEQQLNDEKTRLRSAQQLLNDDNTRLKSAEQQLNDENARLKSAEQQLNDENTRLKSAEQQLSSDVQTLRETSSGHVRILSDTEKRLEGLNYKLRNVIIKFNPSKNGAFAEPEVADGSGESVTSQLDFLEMGLTTAAEEQALFVMQSSKEVENAAAAAASAAATAATSASLTAVEERVLELTRQIQQLLQRSNISQTPPPTSSENSLNEQLNYLEDAFEVIQSELLRAAQLSSSVSANKQNSEQTDAVLRGLWDIILTGLAEIQQQNAARRETRSQMGLEQEDDDDVNDEAVDMNEPYSLQAFSTKVQWLYAQATSLKEHKAVLQRQIKQQRELNNKSESEKDRELKAKADELEQTRVLLDVSDKTAREAQERLADTLSDLDTLQKTSAANESASAKAVQDQLKERDTMIAALESNYQNAQMRLADAEANLSTIQTKLSQASLAKVAAEASTDELEKAIKQKDDELDRMNMMVIELKTDLTIARAELDGAYGSRAQRAAEAAALSKTSDSSELTTQVQRLKAELESTLRDFEAITKESISAEKEKLDLEAKLDDALSAKASLEAEARALREKLEKEIGRLHEQLDAEKLRPPPSPAGVAGSRAGASMLSEQFRATMKEERKKFQEEMREEQAKRRKLEDEMRALRRGQGIGRSPLGPLSPR